MALLEKLDRKEFVDLKNQYVHPSSEVSVPEQLVGRSAELELVRNCFEREGSHIFIWGQRGVGKTSLAHSACARFTELVHLGPAISCEAGSTVNQIFNDIARRAVNKDPSLLKDKSLKLKLSALGLSIEGQVGGFRPISEVDTVNQGSELLNTLFPTDFNTGRKTVVIIDEFDQLQNQDTIRFFTGLAKQMSVDKTDVKLVFCGVASDFQSLIGMHESVGRYLTAIKLSPLTDDEIWQIVDFIAANFEVEFHRGQKVRIGQIACGYPTFAHLVLDEVLNFAFESRLGDRNITQEFYNEGMRRAASGAATHLQSAYEEATMKGTDRYVEVLWSVANGQHIQGRQFKDIKADYEAIRKHRIGREHITKEQNLRNHINALCGDARPLERFKTGWYRFNDPMFRGYVRMIAYNEGIELGDESFRG